MADFWAFLENAHLPDDRLADGYEQAGPQVRGQLKKNIAVQHELLEQRLPPQLKRTEISYGATVCSCTATPAPWCLILHEAAYAAAPRALAAAVPAQLAGVPIIWSVALHEKGAPATPPAPILAAWELAGIENVAAVDIKTFLLRLREFMDKPHCAVAAGPGRVIILGNPAWASEIRAILGDEGKALVRQEAPDPQILLTGDVAEAYYPALCALHPDAKLHVASTGRERTLEAPKTYSAVFSSEVSDLGEASTGLHLDYEHSGCWIWPEVNAAFFLNHKFSLFTVL